MLNAAEGEIEDEDDDEHDWVRLRPEPGLPALHSLVTPSS